MNDLGFLSKLKHSGFPLLYHFMHAFMHALSFLSIAKYPVVSWWFANADIQRCNFGAAVLAKCSQPVAQILRPGEL